MILNIFKILTILIVSYFGILYLLFSYIFEPLKNESLEKYNAQIQNEIQLFEHKIQAPLLNLEYSNITNLTNELIAKGFIDSIKFNLTEYYITLDTLFANSSNIKGRDWAISDITIDVKYGEISKMLDDTYIFKKSDEYNFQTPIYVKFQAFNEENIENSISKISFALPEFNFDKPKLKHIETLQKFEKFLSVNSQKYSKTFTLKNAQNYATMELFYNKNVLITEIYNKMYNIFILFNYIFLVTVLLYFVIYFIIIKSTVTAPLKKFISYLNDINDNRFYKYDSSALKQKEIINVANSISKISKKMATLLNEININKDLLEQHISSDTLTKLPNKKIFENTLKSLFITHVSSYIGRIKLVSLQEYSKEHSQNEIDQFVNHFVDFIRTKIEEVNPKYSSLYRLYGSEFLFIIKNTSYSQIEHIFENMEETLNEFNSKYNFQTKPFHCVAIPFNKYSSIAAIYKDLDSLFDTTINQNKIFAIENEKIMNAEFERLEKIIQSIITNNAFTISTKFDTFSFEETPVLLMQEISPNLIDTDGKIIPIGTFIGVAENLKIAVNFDKDVITKTFQYIKKYDIQHQLAVNISISSICDNNFLVWLETLALYEYKNLFKKVVFSVTAFAAKNNFNEFALFTNELSRFGGQVILKRFNYNDLSMEQLEELKLNYLRVNKDYTTNIDKEKEIILKNMVSFASINKTLVLGDLVEKESDYNSIKQLKFYGTSR